jgi:amidophosphoribosyltransferase
MSDTEILMHLIRKSTAVSFLDKLKESLNLVKGGFAYLLLTETMMIAAEMMTTSPGATS